jgi:flavin reductase (DIM6/NTAB) family NADH-FMN oxidoreductase RutF
VPTRIDCAVTKTGVDIEAYYDRDLFTPELIELFIRQFEQAMWQISEAGEEHKLGDIDLSKTTDTVSALTESIAAKSAIVKDAMLVSLTHFLVLARVVSFWADSSLTSSSSRLLSQVVRNFNCLSAISSWVGCMSDLGMTAVRLLCP